MRAQLFVSATVAGSHPGRSRSRNTQTHLLRYSHHVDHDHARSMFGILPVGLELRIENVECSDQRLRQHLCVRCTGILRGKLGREYADRLYFRRCPAATVLRWIHNHLSANHHIAKSRLR